MVPAVVILLAAASVAAALVAGWVPSARIGAWSIAWTAGTCAALGGMLAARHMAAPSERGRWTLWSVATGCWLAGQLAWNLFELVGFPSSPNVADLAWFAFALFVMAGLLRAPGASRAVRLVALAEALPLVAAAVALTYAELWQHSAVSPLPLMARISALAYPALYVSAAMLTLHAMVGGALRRPRGPGPRLVLLGIVILSVAFISWSEQLLAGSYVTGATIVDPLWLVGLLAVAAGGLLAARAPQPFAPEAELSARGALLPAAMFALLCGALVVSAFEDQPAGARLTLAVGLLCCGAALIARAVLLERRLSALLASERSARVDLAGREIQLAELNERLLEDSRCDSLTGLGNRRALKADLAVLEAPGGGRSPSRSATSTTSRPTTTCSATSPATRRCATSPRPSAACSGPATPRTATAARSSSSSCSTRTSARPWSRQSACAPPSRPSRCRMPPIPTAS